MGVAQVHARFYPINSVHRLVHEVGTQTHFVVHIFDALAPAKGRIHQGAEPGFVKLYRVGSGGTQQFYFPPQNRYAGLHQLCAGGIGFFGVLRVPHAAANDIGSGQGGFEASPGAAAAEANFV